jgi:hypothetical protein
MAERKALKVRIQRLQDGTEAFEILHERYVHFIREADKAGRQGYIAKEIHQLLNEETTRSELSNFFGLDEEEIATIIARAREHAKTV